LVETSADGIAAGEKRSAKSGLADGGHERSVRVIDDEPERDDDEHDPLGWHVISGSLMLDLMRRAAGGEDPDLLFAELWANATHNRD
jgi:hypothetical protein